MTKFGAIAGNVAPEFIMELITVERDVLCSLTLAMVVLIALLLKVTLLHWSLSQDL